MVDDSPWLSLSEAAQLLGVHFTTLRRWADQGLLDYMRTPGGKRRFQRNAIEEFLERHHNASHETLALAQIKDAAVMKTRQDLQAHGMAMQNWYVQMDDDQRMRMRDSGSRLVALMFQYCSRETNTDVFLEEGKRIAEEYGRFCSTIGLAIAECIRTFLFFRRSMLSAVHETGSLPGMGDEDGQRLFERMIVFFDEIMVAMVVEHNQS